MTKYYPKIPLESTTQTPTTQLKLPTHLAHLNKMAAGIDIGATSHWVAVPEGCDEQPVREFSSFTADLYALADWLEKCGIDTIAMESTGVYWIPLFEILESRGFDVKLVDARHVKNVSGRKTDVLDCQWIQQLHTYGLLSAAFRPKENVCALRAYLRQRHMLIEQAAQHIQHMQKALTQMNIQLHHVISDLTGVTGMKIITAIVQGERDPKKLATYRDYRCKNPPAIIEKALVGHYREEHVFALTQAWKLYQLYQSKIMDCDRKIKQQLHTFEACVDEERAKQIAASSTKRKAHSTPKNALSFDVSTHLIQITGVDLTAVPGIEATSALKMLSEIGLDLQAWKTSKHFASWLGLCPGNKVSGGKQLSGKSKRTSNRLASALRMAASTLHHSHSALGAFFRRMKSRLGAPKATTAVAHKLACILFNMLKNGTAYTEMGQDYYEQQYRDRVMNGLQRRAKEMGCVLVALPSNSSA